MVGLKTQGGERVCWAAQPSQWFVCSATRSVAAAMNPSQGVTGRQGVALRRVMDFR